MQFWHLLPTLLAALALIVLVWATAIERFWFTVRSENQMLEVLPENAEPIKVLHISDIHMAPWQKRKQKFLANLATLDFDLVVNTGDNLGHRDAVDSTLLALQGLLNRPGVFVNGSNDYYAPKPRNPFTYLFRPSKRSSTERLTTSKLVGGFTDAGWLNLNNASANLKIRGTSIGFMGVDDPHEQLDELDKLPELRRGLRQPEVIIGVAHAPYLKVIDAFAVQGTSLIFAGHTHGGQVCIPGFGALITNCDLPRKFARGLSSWKVSGSKMWLNVCAGLGHSIYAPVRLACRPEVRLLTLVAKNYSPKA